jgi:hypothetical protein
MTHTTNSPSPIVTEVYSAHSIQSPQNEPRERSSCLKEKRSSKHPARTHLEALKPGVAAAELLKEEEAVVGADDPHVPVQHRHQLVLATVRPPQQRAHQLRGLRRLVGPCRRSAHASPFSPSRGGSQQHAARGGGGAPWVALRPWGRRAWAGEHWIQLDDAQD